jgi:hypothetical protein
VPQTIVVDDIATPLPASEVVRLTVRVDDGKECWINYRDGEGNTDQRLLTGGQELLLELNGPVKFTAGNAAVVTLEVAGRTYRDLGAPGQVVHTEVTAEGVVPLGAGQRYE